MKTITFLLVFIISCDRLYSQYIFPLKEHYDRTHGVYVLSSIDYTNHWSTGNTLSWVLSSYLRMYRATGDKDYLIKFINQTIRIQNARLDILLPLPPPFQFPKKWTANGDTDCDGSECTYFNSLLIYPMAEFVYQIINDPTLYNTNLPLNLIEDENMHPAANIPSYGDFALWLGARVEETFEEMNTNYWNDAYGIKRVQVVEQEFGTAMNFNSPYAAALLFIGRCNTNFGSGNNSASYLSKAHLIAHFYRGNVDIEDHCTGFPCSAISYHYPVLRTMSNNAYFWYHAGWSKLIRDCSFPCSLFYTDQPDYDSYIKFVEDVSHGAMDLWFIRACYESQFAPCSTCTPYFTSTEIERFRNTFTKNIYYTDNTGGHFHNGVNGSNDYVDNQCSPNCPPDLNYGEALDWMPLYKFDGSSLPNVYDILMQHTTGLVSTPSTANLTGPQSFLGLSEVVKAQWDKECVNLTLFNRDVVYDQDFVVKNKLIVAPQEDFTPASIPYYIAGVTDPFAEPKTFTDGGPKDRFIIEAGTTVNMSAGERIVVKSGSSAKLGSKFHAYIDPVLANQCMDGMRIENTPNTTHNHSVVANAVPDIFYDRQKNNSGSVPQQFSISPNPTTGLFTLQLQENILSKISIYNSLGQIVFQSEISNPQFAIDLSSHPRGIYFLKVQSGDPAQNGAGKIYTEKLILSAE